MGAAGARQRWRRKRLRDANTGQKHEYDRRTQQRAEAPDRQHKAPTVSGTWLSRGLSKGDPRTSNIIIVTPDAGGRRALRVCGASAQVLALEEHRQRCGRAPSAPGVRGDEGGGARDVGPLPHRVGYATSPPIFNHMPLISEKSRGRFGPKRQIDSLSRCHGWIGSAEMTPWDRS